MRERQQLRELSAADVRAEPRRLLCLIEAIADTATRRKLAVRAFQVAGIADAVDMSLPL
jgi:hypothetical protein